MLLQTLDICIFKISILQKMMSFCISAENIKYCMTANTLYQSEASVNVLEGEIYIYYR